MRSGSWVLEGKTTELKCCSHHHFIFKILFINLREMESEHKQGGGERQADCTENGADIELDLMTLRS